MCYSNKHGATFTFPFFPMKCIVDLIHFMNKQNHWTFRNCPDCGEFTVVSNTKINREQDDFNCRVLLIQLESFDPII
jgi:predicted RNA-binding Zn-ribbon protein involved in translation (DUF1610 family)